MLDIKRIIQNPQLVMTAMKNRNSDVDIEKLLSLDTKRRKIIGESEQLKAKRNSVSAQIPRLIKERGKMFQRLKRKCGKMRS